MSPGKVPENSSHCPNPTNAQTAAKKRPHNGQQQQLRARAVRCSFGHVVVCVGTSLRRFIIRATYLNHPILKKLLVRTEEEYGFNNVGPTTIPSDESFFQEILRVVSRSDSSSNSGLLSTFEDLQRYCQVGMKNKPEFFSESRPLLHGVSEKSVFLKYKAKPAKTY